MDKPDPARKFVGIQISPVSFVDEGVDEVLDTLQHRVGVNVLMVGTVSWLGLKVGRSISHQFDGWPDHGVPEPFALEGGAYFNPTPSTTPAPPSPISGPRTRRRRGWMCSSC